MKSGALQASLRGAAGVGEGLGGRLKPLSGEGANRSFTNIARHTGVGAASLIASAATRSAINGSSFGDNITAGLPDVIGQSIGRAIGGALKPRIDEAPAQGKRQTIGDALSGDIVNTSLRGYVPSETDPLLASLLAPIAPGLSDSEGAITAAAALADQGIAGAGAAAAEVEGGDGFRRRQFSPGAPQHEITTGPTGREQRLFTDAEQASLIAWIGANGLSASGSDLQNFLVSDLSLRSTGTPGDLQAVLDHYRKTGEIAHGTVTTSYAVSDASQALSAFSQTGAGAFAYAYVNDAALGIPGALFDNHGALSQIAETNPNASLAGEYVGLVAGLGSIAVKAGGRAVATAGSRATLDDASRVNLLAAVRNTGSLSEAKGLVYAQRRGYDLGFGTVLPSLTFRGNQGIDLALQNSATGRLAVFEAKGGFTQRSLSALSRDTQRIVQGSEDFIETRLQRYIQFGDGANKATAQSLQGALKSDTLDSYATFYGSRRLYQLPFDGSKVRPATLIPNGN